MIIANELVSRAEAARMLRLSPHVWDRLAAKHGVRTFQVPGHSRKWFDRRDVENLLDAAVVATEARA